MVYTVDLKSIAFGIESSSLSTRTKRCPDGGMVYTLAWGASAARIVSSSLT